MRRLAAAVCATLALASATPAAAFVVEVTTSVGVEDAGDDAALRRAVQAAVDRVLHDAIAFQPTMIVLTHAVLIGQRLYVRVLLADRDGEQTFDDLAPGPEAPGAPVPEEIRI
jgi:hypothetical protein